MDGERPTRREVLSGGAVAAALLAGCSGSGGSGGSGGSTTASGSSGSGGWRTAELTDVLTGEPFTVADLPKPMVLETFAVWCPVCTNQQEALAAVTEQADDVPVVSLNTDPNEDAEAVRSHAEEHGFDWRYAVAPAAVTQSLIDKFGPGITNAPSAPVVVLCPDGSATYLDDRGVKAADAIISTVEGC